MKPDRQRLVDREPLSSKMELQLAKELDKHRLAKVCYYLKIYHFKVYFKFLIISSGGFAIGLGTGIAVETPLGNFGVAQGSGTANGK